MAKFDYTKLRATAERLIDRFGVAATLVKVTHAGTLMNPGAKIETRHRVDLVNSDIRTQFKLTDPLPYEREGGGLSVTETQRVVTMSTKGGQTPEVGDMLEFVAGGETESLTVKDVAPYAPGGVTMFHSLVVE